MSHKVKHAIVSHETKLLGLLIPSNNHFNKSLQSYTPLKLVCLPSRSIFSWQIPTIHFNSWVKNRWNPTSYQEDCTVVPCVWVADQRNKKQVLSKIYGICFLAVLFWAFYTSVFLYNSLRHLTFKSDTYLMLFSLS